MRKKFFLTTADKIKIACVLEKTKNKNDRIVILCHGITVNKNEDGIFVKLSHQLVQNGVDCLRFDFRGHGESTGKQEEMTISGEILDLEKIVEFVKEKKYREINLLAASFGGGIASLFVSYHPEINKLILWNPIIDYYQFFQPDTPWTKKYFGEDKFKTALKKGFIKIGSRGFKLGSKTLIEARFFKPYLALKNFKGKILFVHGENDTYIPLSTTLKYAKILKAEVVIVKGAEHGFQGKKEWEEEVIKTTVNFLV